MFPWTQPELSLLWWHFSGEKEQCRVRQLDCAFGLLTQAPSTEHPSCLLASIHPVSNTQVSLSTSYIPGPAVTRPSPFLRMEPLANTSSKSGVYSSSEALLLSLSAMCRVPLSP